MSREVMDYIDDGVLICFKKMLCNLENNPDKFSRVKAKFLKTYVMPTIEIHKTTADVVEVKHGKWLDNIEKTTTLGGSGIEREVVCGYKCSLCGRTEIRKEPYCNCGAKMDAK